MNITYSEDKNFTAKTILDFYTVSGNPDAKYGEALVSALKNCGTVITAWDGDKLAALVSVIDDGNLSACLRDLVVAPDYRGKGINDELLTKVKEKYAAYPNFYAIVPDDFHANFFTKVGYKPVEGVKVLTK